MDITELILLLRKDPWFIVHLCREIITLFSNLALSDRVFEGSYQAVLAEAQGGRIFKPSGQVFDHLSAMIETRNALIKSEQTIEKSFSRLTDLNRELANSVRTIVRPLLETSRATRSLMVETEVQAAELARTSPTRLQSVGFGAGGLGPTVARNEAALITSQLEAQAAQLTARGIVPKLIVNPTPAAQALLNRIANAPINKEEAAQKLAPVIAAMRLAMAQAAQRATMALRVALELIIRPIAAALETVVTTLAGRLTSFIIIPKDLLDVILKEAGMGGPSA